MEDYQQITLKDGRKLAFSTYGAGNDGKPIFYFHGWPSSRLEGANYAEVAAKLDGRLIAIDRPGIGQSDLKPNRTLLDWPDDISELADQLGIDKFYVMGASGGGPYVAACAYKIPDRLLGATIIAGLSPMSHPNTKDGMRRMNRLILPMGKSAPWLLGLILRMMRSSFRNPKGLERMLKDLPDVDKALFSKDHADQFLKMGKESFDQGIEGAKVEGRIYAEQWGFELTEITIPVSIWQGSLDVNVPLSNGRILANEIPHGTGHFIEGEGHLSLIINQSEAILKDLLQ